MEHTPSLEPREFVSQLSSAYPYLLLSMLPVGVLLAVAIGTPSLALRGLAVLGPPLVGAFVVLERTHGRGRVVEPLLVLRADVRTLQAGFLVVLSTSVAVVALGAYRPWHYFALVALLYVLVLGQIAAGARPAPVLAQLVVLALSWAYGLTLTYGLFFGGTSTIMHEFYAELTYASGSLVPTDLTHYALFPLYHTFVAGVAHLLGVSVSTVMAAVVPIPYVATIVFVYALFSGITGDDQLGLVTALLYSLHPTVLYYAPYGITRTMAFVGFLVVLWVAYSRHRFSNAQYGLLLGIAIAYVSLVHHVSTLQILSLLVLLALCERVLADRGFVRTPLLALGAVTLVYWSTIASHFVDVILATVRNPELTSSPDVVSSSAATSHHLGYYLQSYLLVCLALVGVGVLLWNYRERYEVVLGLFALCTLPLFVPSPIHALGQTVHLLRMDRYVLLLSPFAAFVGAVGLYGLVDAIWTRSPSSTRRTVRVLVAVVLVVLLASTSVTASSTVPNAADSEDLDWTGPPVHFTESELRGLEFVPAHVPGESSVAGDWQSARYYRPHAYEFEGAEEHGVPIYDRQIIDTPADVYEYEGLLVLRAERLERDGLLLGGAGKGQRAAVDDGAAVTTALQGDDVVYENEDVQLYRVQERDPPTTADAPR